MTVGCAIRRPEPCRSVRAAISTVASCGTISFWPAATRAVVLQVVGLRQIGLADAQLLARSRAACRRACTCSHFSDARSAAAASASCALTRVRRAGRHLQLVIRVAGPASSSGAVRDSAPESRRWCVSAHSATRRRSTGRGQRDRCRSSAPAPASKSKPYCAGFRAMTIAARIIGTYSRVSRGSSFFLAASFQKSSSPRPLHGALHAAGAAVVRSQREVPVAVEHLARASQVLRRRDRRLFRIRPLVDIPVAAQAVFRRRAGHELPDALRLGPRQRVRLEGAFDQRARTPDPAAALRRGRRSESSAGTCCRASSLPR